MIRDKSQIFCDMDGVLVDFETAAIALLNNLFNGGQLPGVKRSKSHFALLERVKDKLGKDYNIRSNKCLSDPIIRSFMFASIGANPGHIFASMPKYEDGVNELWPFLNSTGHIVNLLTAPILARKGAPTTAADGKRRWAKENLTPQPENIIVTPAKQKAAHAVYNGGPNILIDDKQSTVSSWNEAGGIGILHISKNSKKSIDQLTNILMKNV